MPSRDGKPWNFKELVIVFDTFLQEGKLSPTDARVKEDATLLDRTPSSISLRLANFDGLAGGAGLDHWGEICEKFYDIFSNAPTLVRQYAAYCRQEKQDVLEQESRRVRE